MARLFVDRSTVRVISMVLVIVSSTNARAETSTPQLPADKTQSAPRPRRFAVTVNPLRFALGTVFKPQGSLNVEWLATTHHAVVVSPSVLLDGGSPRSESREIPTPTRAKPPLFNIEAGWRFYTGPQLNGFFVGAFMLAAQAREVYPSHTDSWWNAYVGIDVGGQHVFANGVTIGGGLGYQNLIIGEPTPGTDSYLGGGKIMPRGSPRVLLALGYAF